MGRYALVKNNKIKNIIVADEQFVKDHEKDPALDCDLMVNVDGVYCDSHWDYDPNQKTFSKPIDQKKEEEKPESLELANDLKILQGVEAPVDGKTGAGEAGPGSLYIQTDDANSELYINKGPKDFPEWNAK